VQTFPKWAAAGLALGLGTAAFAAPTASDPRIGVMTHFAQGWPTSWAEVTAGIPVGTVRDELFWANVETTAGVYQFPAAFDAYMARLRQDDIPPLIIMSFANPLYDGGDTPYTAAGQAAYARYGAALLNHYGGQIQAMEVWNEFNGSFSDGPATANRAATYTSLLKAAYTQIKAVRPDVTVVGGATSGAPIPYWSELIADGALASMDVLSIHPYRYDSPPEGIENDVAALQALVREHNAGVAKPIWVTEIGWVEQTTPLPVDNPTLAKYVTRAYALLLSAGVDRIFWYLLHDDPGEPMGLYEADGTAKPAAAALATLVAELGGAPFSAKETTPDNVYSLLFVRPTGQEVRVLWSLAPRAVTLHGVTRAVDFLGNQLGTAGAYTLSDAPIFVEGSVTGVPVPTAADETIIASSTADFRGTQGAGGWTYGYIDGGEPFAPAPTFTSNDWYAYWTAPYPYLTVTQVDVHPSVDGASQVKAVRRWTSTLAGSVHLVGDFQGEAQGDGVGVTIQVDGRAVLARTLIGGPGPRAENFDLSVPVSVGSMVDFVVDDGPANDMDYDATAFAVQIRAAGIAPPAVPTPSPAAPAPVTPTPAAAAPVTPLPRWAPAIKVAEEVPARAAPAEVSGAVLADSGADFSGAQGGNGWSYGDFSPGAGAFEAADHFGSDVWTSRDAGLALSATTQHPGLTPAGTPAAAVRRWTSAYAGTVRIAGRFLCTRVGPGAGVTVLVDGQAVVPRTLIGAGAAAFQKTFDLTAAVVPGSTVDFVVDPGAGQHGMSDSASLAARITVP
jgi:hypothetical protein